MSHSIQIGGIFFTKGHRIILDVRFTPKLEGLSGFGMRMFSWSVCKLGSFRIKEKEMAALFLSFQGEQHKHNTTGTRR